MIVKEMQTTYWWDCLRLYMSVCLHHNSTLSLILKTTYMKFAYVLVAASIAIASCKKNKSNPSDPGNITRKITRIEENGGVSARFAYNADGAIQTINTNIDGDDVVFTFSYNAQKKPKEVVNSQGSRSVYIYDAAGLKMIETYEENEKVSENHFTYENGRVASNTLFVAIDGGGNNVTYEPVQRFVYRYTAAGALDKVSTYEVDDQNGQFVLTQDYVYTQYDTKKNPLTVLSDFSAVLFQQPININNPVVEKMLSPGGTVIETTNNVYTYDAAGYPVTCTSTSLFTGGQPNSSTLKYFY